ncbi:MULTISPECIES: hypothetical protein [unclassified Streptomyces]|uniref:hypothetical protein n=1 Tax=unclassified Streptomyces TaxID=2593676 RepID=UPI00340F79C2
MLSSTARHSARYSLIVILDIEGFGRRTDPDQTWLRERLRAVVTRSLQAARIEEPPSEDRGDAVLLILPGTVSKTDLLGGFVRTLVGELREHARSHTGDREMRLRAAFHAGEVARHGTGWVGADLNTAFRIADMEPLRQALAGAPGAVLSLAVSHVLHQGVIRHRHPGLADAEFAPAVLSAKELRDEKVWIRVPGRPVPPGLHAASGAHGHGPRAVSREPSVPPVPTMPPPVPPMPPRPSAGSGNLGISATNVTVTGVGVNHGAVSQSWTSTTGPDADGAAGLLRELSRLRTDLKEARRRDQIDDFTFQAADEELQTAERNAETRHEEGRGRLLRALMSLRGIVADTAALAGLVATVTQLIQLVKGQA